MKTDDTLVALSFCCDEDWEAMSPCSATTRHCHSCREDVTDLSAMTQAQARAFRAAHPQACISYLVHGDDVIFQPEPHALHQASGGLKGMVAAALLSVPMLLAGCQERPAPAPEAISPVAVDGSRAALKPGAPLRAQPPAAKRVAPPKPDALAEHIAHKATMQAQATDEAGAAPVVEVPGAPDAKSPGAPIRRRRGRVSRHHVKR